MNREMNDSEFGSPAEFIAAIEERNPGEPVFLQAVREVVESVWEYVEEHPEIKENNLLSRMLEPERVVSFRVPWVDDEGKTRVNRGYRVQFNSALGPYKGGLRFAPHVSPNVLKALAFEQTFKNSLTTLNLGGGKGGSDFNPRGRSIREIQAFCQSFMIELCRHVGENTDIPAGDQGVSGREIGFLFGQYKRLTNQWVGTLTGKPAPIHSNLRTEATGYGVVYFIEQMLKEAGQNFKGKSVTISGSGNVAQFTAEKLIQLGATVVSLSDSGGTIHDAEGIDTNKLEFVKELKNVKRGRIEEYSKKFKSAKYIKGGKPWDVPCDIAIPAATQNELDLDDAKTLISNGVFLVCEAANLPCTSEAVEFFLSKKKVIFGPAKAANAGGVATSGLEMAQNSMRINWTREEVDEKLKEIMKKIHDTCVEFGREDKNYINYVRGANIGGFAKVASAMLAQGAV